MFLNLETVFKDINGKWLTDYGTAERIGYFRVATGTKATRVVRDSNPGLNHQSLVLTDRLAGPVNG